MDFTPEINALERAVDYMKEVLAMPLEKLGKRQTKKVFSRLTEHIDDVYYIDDLMPLEEFADKFTDPADRKAFFRVLDLLDEAFGMLDEILGPAEEWDDEVMDTYPEFQTARREIAAQHRQETEPQASEGPMSSDGPQEAGESSDPDDDPYAKLLRSIKPNRHAS